jgi:hypothetical protein
MLRFVLKHTPIKRLTRGIPILGLLTVAEFARLARGHLAKLDPAERRRLVQLVGRLRHGSASLSKTERNELGLLVAKLEPRAFAGSATDQMSPVPVPKRLLYGPKSASARIAADKRS